MLRLKHWTIGEASTHIRFLPPTIPQRPSLESEAKGRGLVSHCFENCWHVLLRQYEAAGREFVYVEGWCILQPFTSLAHGWLIDQEGCLVETTFDKNQIAPGSVFAGYVLPREQHLRRARDACHLAELTGAAECTILTPKERARARARCERVARSVVWA